MARRDWERRRRQPKLEGSVLSRELPQRLGVGEPADLHAADGLQHQADAQPRRALRLGVRLHRLNNHATKTRVVGPAQPKLARFVERGRDVDGHEQLPLLVPILLRSLEVLQQHVGVRLDGLTRALLDVLPDGGGLRVA